MLQLFFKIPNALDDILSYMNSLNYTDRIHNYVQTNMWKNKLSLYKSNDIVLPLIFYFDDLNQIIHLVQNQCSLYNITLSFT